MAVYKFCQALARRGVLQVPLEADECGFDGNYGATILQDENMYVRNTILNNASYYNIVIFLYLPGIFGKKIV